MKTLSLAIAGLAAAAAAALSPAVATAQTRTVTTRTVVHSHTGPAYVHRTRQVCKVSFRHGHRVRTCRTVSY